jgi:biotin transport system substrate-specific component
MKTIDLSFPRLHATVLGKMLGVFTFTILLCFSALIKIPLFFTPVPITLQNFVVFSAGALLGPSLGMAAVALYIVLGILGAPFFSNSLAGVFYLFGPTGGYLLGFLLAAGLIGHLIRLAKTKNIFYFYSVMILGMSAIYVCGGLWLKIGYGWDFKKIFFLGVAPFIVADFMKAYCAAFISQRAGR